MTISRFLLPAILFFISMPLRAAEKDSLSLAECLKLALERSPAVQAAERAIIEKEAEYDMAKGVMLPEVDLGLATRREMAKPFGYNISYFSIDLPLDLQKIFLGYSKAGEARLEEAKFLRERTRDLLAYQVKVTYYDLLVYAAEYQVGEKALNYIAHHGDVVRSLRDSGVRTELDLLRVQAEMERVAAEMESARAPLEKARIRLNSLIGVDLSRPTQVAKPLTLPSELPTLEELIQTARKTSPELQALQMELQALDSEWRLSRGYYLPQAFIEGGYTVDRDPTGNGNYWTIRGGLYLPIFDFGARRNESQARAVRLEKARWQFKERERVILQELAAVSAAIKARLKAYQSYQKAFLSARRNLEVAEVGYRNLFTSETDLLDVHRQLREIEILKERAFLECWKLQAKLEFLIEGRWCD